MSLRSIPKFQLYGESPENREPPFVHIESIEARSRAADWEIVPHRHDTLSHFLLIESHGGSFRVDDATHHFQSPAFIGVPSKLVHGFEFAPETKGLVLTMSEGLVAAALAGLADPQVRTALSDALLVKLDNVEEAHYKISAALRQIGLELQHRRVGQLSAIMAHIAIILVAVVRQHQLLANVTPAQSGDFVLVAQLRRLIEKQFADHCSINDFADTMGVTGARLNNACRRVTGCSTLQLVHAATLSEAKRHLVYTTMSMSEIAYSLGFVDPAYFSRFFTQREGVSPLAFRKRHTQFDGVRISVEAD